MSGTPTEAEIQAQLVAVVDSLESFRSHVDGTQAAAGGKWDTLEKALEGEYTPVELSNWANTFRAGCSALLSPGFAASALQPILLEYAARIDSDASGTQGFGTGKRNTGDLFRALYDWFVAKSYTVKSRTITYDTSVTAGGSNVGNGGLSRLTVDENGFNLEACTVEKKLFKCVGDQNTGNEATAEVFECVGEASSFDSVLRASFGSGGGANTVIASRNAGSGRGGSLLTNSSFSDYDSTATPKFTGWDLDSGAAGALTQDTTNYYRTHPGAQVDASLKLTWGGTTLRIQQTLENMKARRFDPDTPYVLRFMVNADIGSASGGTVTVRLGGTEKDFSISGTLTGNGWVECVLDFDSGLWFKNFNAAGFTVEIEWASGTSGYILVDDAILAPMDLIDGTYWFLRGNAASPVNWLVNDILQVTDTGGAPSTGKLQWWFWVAGYGYLPSSGTPTLADP